ncbi:MAG: hypothetical protein WCS44_04100, partial [Bacillota bacterium]
MRVVLTELAGQANVNIIVDDNLQRRLSLKLDQVTFEDVLEMLEETFSVEVKKSGNMVVVTQKDQFS